MDHHHIIHDPSQVKIFAELFVPLKAHQAINLSLIARRKYAPTLTESAYILQRVIIGGDENRTRAEDHLYRYLLRLECPVGSYIDKEERPIPDESLAVYAFIDPKDTIKALSSTLHECVERMSNGDSLPNAFNLYKEQITKTKSIGGEKYRQLDIDTKDSENIQIVRDLLFRAKIKPLITVETRGGYHVIYRNKKEIDHKFLHDFKKSTVFEKPNVYGVSTKDYWFSITGYSMMIVPGTYQGGFKTKISKIFESPN